MKLSKNVSKKRLDDSNLPSNRDISKKRVNESKSQLSKENKGIVSKSKLNPILNLSKKEQKALEIDRKIKEYLKQNAVEKPV